MGRTERDLDVGRAFIERRFMPGARVTAGPSNGLTIRLEEGAPVEVNIPSLSDHLVVVALQDGILREWALPDGRHHRRWSVPGSLTVAPAHSEYRCNVLTRSKVLIVDVSTALLSGVANSVFGATGKSVNLVNRYSVTDVHLYGLLTLLMQEIAIGDDASTHTTDLLSRSFVISLIRAHSTISIAQPRDAGALPSGRIDRIVNFMKINIDRNLSVGELAEEAGLSKSYFATSFRQAKGQSPHHYLLLMRIEKARELLQRSDLSIIEVGLACGFERPTHFAATFNKLVGMSPRAWRAARQ